MRKKQTIVNAFLSALSSGGAILSFIFAKVNCIFYMHVKHIYTDRLIGLLDYIKVLQD